ncbi:hypothetical protein QFC20_006497 [Naganishia adeliensis]|uniref:Uncharacterized protein n=1 Tax=Naganishia adeliensis TaxID=92952 RepID=A0ACC2VC24_9TREE|nr:hypothetical protein QFC20_006497 [Naganishia adeliensis]
MKEGRLSGAGDVVSHSTAADTLGDEDNNHVSTTHIVSQSLINTAASGTADRVVPPKSPSPRLPLELILEIASHLAGDNAFATLASLNTTNRSMNEKTLRILYEVVVWDDPRKDFWEFLGGETKGFEAELVVPKGYAHTRVIVLNEAERDELSRRDDTLAKSAIRQEPGLKSEDTIVPHRIATIVKSPRRRLIGSDSAGNVLDDALYKRPTCRVEVTGRISSEYLHGLLCGLRLKWETSKKNLPSNLLPIQEISSISLKSANARIFDSPSLRPSSRFILRQGECPSFTLKLHPDMEADQGSRETIDAVFDMLNAPREEDLFRKPSLLITNCSLRMYAVVIESLPALLASQPRSGFTIDICIAPAGSPICFSELEAAFRHTIEIWKDVWTA